MTKLFAYSVAQRINSGSVVHIDGRYDRAQQLWMGTQGANAGSTSTQSKTTTYTNPGGVVDRVDKDSDND